MSQAVIIGTSGGIGAALARAVRASKAYDTCWSVSRSAPAPDLATDWLALDLTDEASIAEAAQKCRDVRLVIVATGELKSPEKTYLALDPEALTRAFQINTIGPALVAKHFAPLVPRSGRSVFAVLSARVGSIGDNRLGGWYGYRASKAALNQVIRTLAVEQTRSRPDNICVALHPGTVDTALSQPFQSGTPAEKLFSPERAARDLLKVMDGLTPADTGGFFAWDGQAIPW
jgi:NAD(P)-dependent dehydrogenase (short-subunit alcohol dehydrogenase family)